MNTKELLKVLECNKDSNVTINIGNVSYTHTSTHAECKKCMISVHNNFITCKTNLYSFKFDIQKVLEIDIKSIFDIIIVKLKYVDKIVEILISNEDMTKKWLNEIAKEAENQSKKLANALGIDF